ncbi:hypothetical protein Pyn_21289 [Prunus yedoensis var. nudiflora]|uniref:Uncharacterized protein n=1 Tax=Prunus yedoensis var. nudiflora TaxID=2094558 RepID=A0A314XJM6_PRUYE|nr:hypothetical protein Pyn_21289 [Prunus yedoensis var. nudiflora]
MEPLKFHTYEYGVPHKFSSVILLPMSSVSTVIITSTTIYVFIMDRLVDSANDVELLAKD